MTDPKLAFAAIETESGQEALARLTKRYGTHPVEAADVIVALGGDGFMLHTLHTHIALERPIFGMHRGSIGFLMNEYRDDDLPARIAAADRVELHPLGMRVEASDGVQHQAMAINEVSLLRQSRQAAKLRIDVDGVTRLEELICDGALVATPAGSTAYNLSVAGPIIPLGAELLALTPISAFRPRRWRGALLPATATVTIEVIEADKRPVSATADYTEVRDVRRVEVSEARDRRLVLLFDPEHNLGERVLKEQFAQ